MIINNNIRRSTIAGHPYHLVTYSPWPTITSFGLMNMLIGIVLIFNNYNKGGTTTILGFISLLLGAIRWWEDVIREAKYIGDHSIRVVRGIKIGFFLFLLTEIVLFGSFFWAFIYSCLICPIEVGVWPGIGLTRLNPLEIPLINTIILLSSGAACTWAHHCVLYGENEGKWGGIIGLVITIMLALIFTILQGYEYYLAPFDISDGVYACTFYLTTSLHGVHVIIGTLFILVALIRLINNNCTTRHHENLEFSLIYFHLVDVVWLALYIIYYWWGSNF